jgi:hypothetical protein
VQSVVFNIFPGTNKCGVSSCMILYEYKCYRISLMMQDGMIRKETYLNDNCLTELRRIIESSEILKEDDQVIAIILLSVIISIAHLTHCIQLWPEPDEVGRQVLVVNRRQHGQQPLLATRPLTSHCNTLFVFSLSLSPSFFTASPPPPPPP